MRKAKGNKVVGESSGATSHSTTNARNGAWRRRRRTDRRRRSAPPPPRTLTEKDNVALGGLATTDDSEPSMSMHV